MSWINKEILMAIRYKLIKKIANCKLRVSHSHSQFFPFINDANIMFCQTFQSKKMYSFLPHAKMNGKVGFHAWFPLWFINIQRVVIFYGWIFLIRLKINAALCCYICISIRWHCFNRLLRESKMIIFSRTGNDMPLSPGGLSVIEIHETVIRHPRC